MDLVDEEDDVPAGVDLLEDLLHALFEIAAVARTGHERTHIERVKLLILERLGNITGGDGLRKTFHNGGLTHTGLADEDRVVLGAAREHLHDALSLDMTANDRIELVLTRGLREVTTKLIEHRGASLLALTSATTNTHGLLALEAGDQLINLVTHARQIGAELDKHLGGNAVGLAGQTEEQMLSADVRMTQLQALAHGVLDNLLGARREGNVSRRGLLALTDNVNNLLADILERDVQRFERLSSHAFALTDETEQDVFGAEVVVLEVTGLFLRKHDDPAGSVGKPFEHWLSLNGIARLVASSLNFNDATRIICQLFASGVSTPLSAMSRSVFRFSTTFRKSPALPQMNLQHSPEFQLRYRTWPVPLVQAYADIEAYSPHQAITAYCGHSEARHASSRMVKGPSLTISTSIIAPNSPSSTWSP